MKLNIIYSLLVLTFLTTITFSQEGWIRQTSGTNNSLYDVFFKDQNNGWIVGNYGTILRTTDGGTNWISASSGTNNSLYSVFFADYNIGWCVGLNGTILKSTDGGINWGFQTSGTNSTLNSVFFIDQNTGWIAAGSNVLKTTNGGADWLTQSVGPGNYSKSVFFVNQDTGWTAGHNLGLGTIFKTTDSGTNWVSQIEIPLEDFFSVQFINPNIGWAVSTHIEGPPGEPFFGTIFSTSDGGINWISGYSFPDLKDVYFVDQNTGWVVDNLDANTGRIHKTTNGVNWTLQLTGTPYTRLFSIFFTDANTGWAVGEYGIILRTTNGGIPTAFQLSISVSDSWNLVSVPGINPDGMGINNWWMNHTGAVYKYSYGPGYTETNITTPGEGYWMKNSGVQTYNTGDEWPTDGVERVPHLPIFLTTGWNIIGGFEDTVAVTSLTTTPPGQIYYPIYKYMPGVGYQTANNFEPGYGYWIKADSDCHLNISGVSAKGKTR
jgi:photosystem II stability/assembly factor-like uncharacterized protein